jgi:hypothetical protein
MICRNLLEFYLEGPFPGNMIPSAFLKCEFKYLLELTQYTT